MTTTQLRMDAAGRSVEAGTDVAGYPVGRAIAGDTFDNLGVRVQMALLTPGDIHPCPAGRKMIEGIDTFRH